MKRERLHLSQHQCIETGRDLNGRFWVGYSSGVATGAQWRISQLELARKPIMWR